MGNGYDYERKKQSQEKALIHSGNRIVTARPKGVTAEDPANRKPSTLEHPIAFEGFERVGRTCWIVAAARWKYWGYPQLIAANQKHEYLPHESRQHKT